MKSQKLKRTRVKLHGDDDLLRGDPAKLVIGNTEQPAKIHRPLPKKPKISNAQTIRYDIQVRMDELRPVVAEYKELAKAIELLESI